MGWSKEISKDSFEGRENISCKIGLIRVKKKPKKLKHLYCNSEYSQRTLQTSTFPAAMSAPGNQSSESSRTGSCIHDLAASPFHPANPHSWHDNHRAPNTSCSSNQRVWARQDWGKLSLSPSPPHSHPELPRHSHPQRKCSTSWSPRSHSSPSWSNPRKRFV